MRNARKNINAGQTGAREHRLRGGLHSIILLLSFALVAPGAGAIDLLESYHAALTHDATYQAARAARASGQEAVPQAMAQLMPNISAAYSRSKLDTVSPSYVGLPDNRQEYFSQNRALTLRQPILRLALVAGYQQAKYLAEEADSVFEREHQNLAVRVSSAYFEALLANEQLMLMTAQKETTAALLDSARAAFARGLGTRTEIDEAQAKYDQVIADELAARLHIDYTRHELETLINRQVDQLPLDFDDTFTFLPLAPAELAYWQDKALDQNPEIKALEAQFGAAGKQIDKNRAGHYPTIDLVVQRTLSSGENLTSPLNSFKTTSLGVQVNIPLFAGGYHMSAIRQAHADRDEVAQQLEAARRKLGLQVRKEFQNVTEGVLRIQALEQAVNSAGQSLVSTRKSQQAGIRSRLDVLDAEQRLVNARRDLAEARLVYLLSHIKLASLVGAADLEKIAQINTVLTANRDVP